MTPEVMKGLIDWLQFSFSLVGEALEDYQKSKRPPGVSEAIVARLIAKRIGTRSNLVGADRQGLEQVVEGGRARDGLPDPRRCRERGPHHGPIPGDRGY